MNDHVKAALAVLMVVASIAVVVLYLLGMVQATPEGGAMAGYIIGEARPILASYFRKE